jgi:hypothetical protein
VRRAAASSKRNVSMRVMKFWKTAVLLAVRFRICSREQVLRLTETSTNASFNEEIPINRVSNGQNLYSEAPARRRIRPIARKSPRSESYYFSTNQ